MTAAALPPPTYDLLAGLQVLDLTRNLPGPYLTQMLADLGAVVTKIEPPAGDEARLLPALFAGVNRGKAGLRLDLRQAADRERLLQRVAGADAVVEGFRPGVLSDMGLGWNVLRAANPRLVLCSISGYGQQGPWCGRAGHDLNFMAMSGALDQMRSADGDIALGNIQWGDLCGGTLGAGFGLLAALWSAQRSGRGRHVDVSMAHGVFAQLVMPLATGQMGMADGTAPRRPGPGQDLLNGALPCYALYRTADGRHLAVGALEHRFWQRFCQAVGEPAWADLHWHRGLPPDSPASNALRAQVAALVARHPLAHWVQVFDAVDACVTPVLTLDEALAHPLFATRPAVVEIAGAGGPAVQGMALPLRFQD